MSKEYKPSPLPYERVGRWIKDAEGRTVCSMETAFHGKDAVTADVIVAVVNSHATLTADLARVTAERDRLREACVNTLSRIEQLQDQWGKEGFTDGTARMLREALIPAT